MTGPIGDVIWASVALRDAAGNIMSWVVVENPHVTIRASTIPMGRDTFLQLLQKDEVPMDLDIRIEGRARGSWTAGAEDAHRHGSRAIGSGPQSIGDGS